MKITIHTDGGCRPTNPGPGGWAAVIDIETKKHTETYELFGFSENSTNNRMELTAIFESLVDLGKKCNLKTCEITILSDSEWSVKSLRGEFKSRKNRDLLDKILKIVSECQLCEFQWIRGHDGNEKNERCDELVKFAVENKHGGMNSVEHERKEIQRTTFLKEIATVNEHGKEEMIEIHRLPSGGIIGIDKNYVEQVGRKIVDPYQDDEWEVEVDTPISGTEPKPDSTKYEHN